MKGVGVQRGVPSSLLGVPAAGGLVLGVSLHPMMGSAVIALWGSLRCKSNPWSKSVVKISPGLLPGTGDLAGGSATPAPWR